MKKSNNKLIIGVIILLVIAGIIYFSTSKTTIKDINPSTNQDNNVPKTTTNPPTIVNPTNEVISPPVVEEKSTNITNSTQQTTQEIKILLGKTITEKINGWNQNIALLEITNPTTATIKIEATPRTVSEGSTYGISNINANIKIKDIFYDTNNKDNSYIIITVL